MFSADKFLMVTMALAALAIVSTMIIASVDTYRSNQRESKCESYCEIRKSRIISSECYCASENGWTRNRPWKLNK